MEKIIKIYVRLLDEGSVEVFRPTNAIQLKENTYRILPCEGYDPEDEIWEFLPGAIVKGDLEKNHEGDEFLMAIKHL